MEISERHLVVGAGEVGSAVSDVLKADVRDIEPVDLTGDYRFLHIAFPYFPGFEEAVRSYEDEYDTEFTVVHSTVPVGTCDQNGWTHSPVRGRHPHLTEGVRTFEKHIGGPDEDTAWRVAREFVNRGVRVKIHDRAATTEAGKLWELAQFGVEIAMNKRIHEWCEQNGIPFEEMYADFGNSYNEGFERLGESRFVKPVLKYDPRPIGGHCVVESMPFLGVDWVDDMISPYTDRDGAPEGGSV